MRVRSSLLVLLFVAATVAGAGCSPGGGTSSPSPTPTPTPPPPSGSPTIQMLPPTSYDFGKVTAGNTPAPLQVTLGNTGTAPLNVTGITLNSPTGGPYALAVGGGAKPCGATAPTIAAADACTVQVLFQPTTDGTFDATLQVGSNASNAPTASLSIAGSSEQVQTLSVRVNQIDVVCAPSTPANTAIAYVSVTDQGGFSVLGLLAVNFLVTQGMAPGAPPATAQRVDQVYKNVAIAALLDYSNSLTSQPVAFADMKTGFSDLLGGLKSGDIGEVVKFATEYEVVQPFTSDKALLQAKIAESFDRGNNTRLYDTVYRAVDDTAATTTATASYRRAVIVATDGVQTLPTSATSVHSLQTVIDNAKSKNVPIFTIGIGASINASVLNRMAADTGGRYYQANTSQNLATIYQQLATLLFERQYVLTFPVTGTAGSTYNVGIRATTLTSVSGEGSRSITACSN